LVDPVLALRPSWRDHRSAPDHTKQPVPFLSDNSDDIA
jgi:hypothetical protein